MVASMGPRFCKRGNGCPGGGPVGGFRASMGPRFCKRGNGCPGGGPVGGFRASMGPRFCKRGNLTVYADGTPRVVELQWGHAFVSVET